MKSPLNAKYTKDGRFKIEGSFEHNLGKYKLKDLFSSLIKESSEIKDAYLKAISNDGVIVGNERSEIISEVDDFFKQVVIFRQFINASLRHRDPFEEIDFKVNLDFFASRFTATGYIKAIDIQVTINFAKWYDEKVVQGLKDLIETYRAACEDGVITVDEIVTLNEKIDEILYQLLVIRFQIEYMIISG